MIRKSLAGLFATLFLIYFSGYANAAGGFVWRHITPADKPGKGEFTDTVTTAGGCLHGSCGYLPIRQVYWADFNGDKITDLLYRDDNWTLWPGTVDGTFDRPIKSSGTCGTSSCAALVDGEILLGDFNGDDIADILNRGQRFQVWLGTESGAFSAVKTSTVSCYYESCQRLNVGDVLIGDFSGDGISDVLHLGQNLTVWRGTAKGTFLDAVETTGGCGSKTCDKVERTLFRTGDFNGDGASDVLLRGTNLMVWYGNASGQFLAPKEITGGCFGERCDYLHTSKFHVGDFNGDGKDDVLYRDRNLTVRLGKEDGSFTSPVESYSGCGRTGCSELDWRRVRVGDFTGDLASDVLYLGRNLTVWAGSDSGQFSSAVESVGGCANTTCDTLHYYNVHIGDFNGDRSLDVLHRGDNLEVWLSTDDS